VDVFSRQIKKIIVLILITTVFIINAPVHIANTHMLMSKSGRRIEYEMAF
jgi:hypothetical protein